MGKGELASAAIRKVSSTKLKAFSHSVTFKFSYISLMSKFNLNFMFILPLVYL